MQATLTERFLDYERLVRGCTESTLRSYRTTLSQFVASLDKAGVKVTETKPADLRRFLAELVEAGLSESTVAQRSAALKAFFRWLQDEGIVPRDPARRVRVKTNNGKLPRVLPIEDVERLIVAPSPLTWTGLRDRAMLQTLYGGGLRVAELVGLDIEDVDFRRFVVRVRCAKGGQERYTPIGPRATRAITEYRETVPWPDEGEADAVFVSCARESERTVAPRGRITTRSVGRLVARYVKKAGLDRRTTAHTLRHCCGTHMLKNGANVRVVQAQLGHASISNTEVYLHLTTGDLNRAYRQFHPRS